MSVYKGRYVFNWMGEGWVVEATIRSFPDYDKLPDYHYLPLSATSIDGREPDDFQPQAQMKRVFHQNKLNPGDDETKAEFCRNCIVPQKFVKKDYVDHLAQIEMRKEKRKTESERQQTQWLEQLYTSDQISSWKVHEHGIVFKGKKPEQVAYIKYMSLGGSYQAWRKGLHCVKKRQLWAQKVMKRKGL